MIFNIGDSFEENFIVSDEIYSGFIQIFKDTNPLHTVDNFAIEKGFKGKVMHGNILNGFLSYFIGECLPTKNVIIHSQEIQFKNAVYLNDQLQFHSEIIGVYESVNAIEFRFDFKNESKKIVAKGKIQIGLFI
jgi:3-hydroxybutyryl-CoA dehydratase